MVQISTVMVIFVNINMKDTNAIIKVIYCNDRNTYCPHLRKYYLLHVVVLDIEQRWQHCVMTMDKIYNRIVIISGPYYYRV